MVCINRSIKANNEFAVPYVGRIVGTKISFLLLR